MGTASSGLRGFQAAFLGVCSDARFRSSCLEPADRAVVCIIFVGVIEFIALGMAPPFSQLQCTDRQRDMPPNEYLVHAMDP